MRFEDRHAAGVLLGERLRNLADHDVVVVGLPRGGVPVAYEVARCLNAPLDVIIVRKIGLPRQPELAVGAIGEGGVRVLNDDIIDATGISPDSIATIERNERTELLRRSRQLRGDRQGIPLEGRTAVIVDDGIATGATAEAACKIARARGAQRVILAVPVASSSSLSRLAGSADKIIALTSSDPFSAVGQFYDDFSQTTDAEVVALLDEAEGRSIGDRLDHTDLSNRVGS